VAAPTALRSRSSSNANEIIYFIIAGPSLSFLRFQTRIMRASVGKVRLRKQVFQFACHEATLVHATAGGASEPGVGLMNVDGCATYSNNESIDESIYHEVDVSAEHRHVDLSVRSSMKP
jgi:hypothetical protein